MFEKPALNQCPKGSDFSNQPGRPVTLGVHFSYTCARRRVLPEPPACSWIWGACVSPKLNLSLAFTEASAPFQSAGCIHLHATGTGLDFSPVNLPVPFRKRPSPHPGAHKVLICAPSPTPRVPAPARQHHPPGRLPLLAILPPRQLPPFRVQPG